MSARRRVLPLALVVLVAAAAAAAQQDVPELTAPVNDFAGVIDEGSARRIEDVIRRLQAASGDVIVVATVNTVAPYANATEYAVKLFENRGRGIGQRGGDNGLLVLLAIQERQVRVEVGYGLEPYITDGFAGETSRQVMAPHFRRGDYGEGVYAGVARIAGRIAQGRGVELEGVPQPSSPTVSTPRVPGVVLFLLFIVGMRILSGLGRARRRRSRWGRRNTWSGWHSGVGPFGGGFGGGLGGGFGGFGGGGGGGGFGGFGGGRSGGGGGGASW